MTNGKGTYVTSSDIVQQRLLTEGAKFTPLSPEQFGGFVKSEIAKWAKVIQQSGIRVD